MRLTVALSLAALAVLEAQAPNPSTASAAAARLRSLYMTQAYVDGWIEGEKLAKRFPRSPEVRAWYIINYSTSGLSEQAIDSARTLIKQFPNSPWSKMALGFALSRNIGRDKAAIPSARAAVAQLPNDATLAFLYTQVLERSGEYVRGLAFLDSIAPRFPKNANLIAQRGVLERWYARQRDADPKAMERSRAAYAEALAIDSTNPMVLYLAATNTTAQRGDTTTFAMLKRASRLSPFSTAIHNSYWPALQARRDLPDSVKRAMGVADVERFLAGRPNEPAFMFVGAGGYATFGLADKQREIHEAILRDHPKSRYAYMVQQNRVSMFRDSVRPLWDTTMKPRPTSADSLRLKREYRRLLTDFLALPYHYSSSSRGDAYLTLFSELRQDSLNVSKEEMLATIQGMVKYNTYNPMWTHYDAPILLAERKIDLAYARQLADESDAAWQRNMIGDEKFRSVAEIAEQLDMIKSLKHDARGWIAFQSGRLEEAEKELNAAREASPRNPTVYYHLGRVAETQTRMEAAEQFYAKGYQYETSGFRRGRQNATALKRIFEAKSGSAAGFEAYVEKLKEEDRVRRKTQIANAVLKDPQDVPSFSLERLVLTNAATGERVTQKALEGKIGIVNFWGVWCGPCVAEMPQLQKLHEQLKGDTSVVFLTVDYNDNIKTVRDFMNEKKYDMPVLLDDGWVTEKARINAYPTTWFIGKDGKIAFIHKGASDVVTEEFLWRVEMLREGLKAGGKAVP